MGIKVSKEVYDNIQAILPKLKTDFETSISYLFKECKELDFTIDLIGLSIALAEAVYIEYNWDTGVYVKSVLYDDTHKPSYSTVSLADLKKLESMLPKLQKDLQYAINYLIMEADDMNFDIDAKGRAIILCNVLKVDYNREGNYVNAYSYKGCVGNTEPMDFMPELRLMSRRIGM